jgi:mono/diheme cytochrome c family protein
MSRPARVSFLIVTAVAVAASVSACGTEKISVPKTSSAYRGAVLFSQRCSGCHTLAYAATHGSATNVRTALINNGPNFDVRCERPVTRVLYAIENGGFSGAIMPQNIVVGPDAKAVAQFVSQYAGRQAPMLVGQTPCSSQSIGSLSSVGTAGGSAAGTTGKHSAGTSSPSSGAGTTTGPSESTTLPRRAKAGKKAKGATRPKGAKQQQPARP